MTVSDGQIADPSSSTTHKAPFSRTLMTAWREVSTMQRQMLSSISIADLLERSREEADKEAMYYI